MDNNNVKRFPVKNKRKGEIIDLVIDRAKEALVCIIKLQVASEKLFSQELNIEQLRDMEIQMTKFLEIAEKDKDGLM